MSEPAMDLNYQHEIRIDGTTYTVRMRTQDSADRPVEITVLGAGPTGEITTELHGTIAADAVGSVARLVSQVLTAASDLGSLADTTGTASRTRTPRPQPVNHGKPWTEQDNQALREVWLAYPETTDIRQALSEVAEQLGRGTGAIRSQLGRAGLDPDIPGRTLSAAAAEIVAPREHHQPV